MISDKTFDLRPDTSTFYLNPDGYFLGFKDDSFLDKEKLIVYNWSTLRKCRTEWAWDFDPAVYNKLGTSKFIGFMLDNINIGKINKFFEIIENELKIPEDKQSVFYRVTDKTGAAKNKIIIIELSDFWIANDVKHSFMSLFLRCAAVYFPNVSTVDEALNNYELAARIKKAIKHFLAGNTKENFTMQQFKDTKDQPGGYFGVVAMFQNKTLEELSNLLLPGEGFQTV